MPVETKPFWQSKVIMVNIVLGVAMIVGVFVPSVGDFLKTYLGTETAAGWAFVNVVLRIFNSNISIS